MLWNTARMVAAALIVSLTACGDDTPSGGSSRPATSRIEGENSERATLALPVPCSEMHLRVVEAVFGKISGTAHLVRNAENTRPDPDRSGAVG